MKLYQEKIYSFELASNGAGPLWCAGSSCIAAVDDNVFVSGWETLKEIPPLNCARWVLYKKNKQTWTILHKDTCLTREPSPICVFNDGRVFVSENPFMLEPEAYHGVCLPRISQFSPPDYVITKKFLFQPCEPVTLVEHSYRNFSADGENRRLILFHNKDYDRAYWNLFDSDCNCIKSGKIYWPWGYDYEKPQRIRLCYNSVQLKNDSVYIFGTSDIPEPNIQWRKYKREITGREWDFDFRRVFFTFTPDIKTTPFRYWIEISSREKSAGKARNCDLLVDNNEYVHLLWWEKSCDERLRGKFFPDQPLTHSLKYAKLKGTKILEQKEIMFFPENTKISSGIVNIDLIWGHFHISTKQTPYIFATISGTDDKKNSLAENWLFEIDFSGNIKSKKFVHFSKPFTFAHIARTRNGNQFSNKIHIYGNIAQTNNEMWYGCIELDY